MREHNYIESRLREWSIWRNKIIGEGLGYPSQSAFAAMRYNKSKSSVALFYDNPEAEEIDQIINHLMIHKRIWAGIIELEFYGRKLSVSDKARILQIDRKKYYDMLNSIKIYIEGRLGV